VEKSRRSKEVVHAGLPISKDADGLVQGKDIQGPQNIDTTPKNVANNLGFHYQL
jgi:hypothetical protein